MPLVGAGRGDPGCSGWEVRPDIVRSAKGTVTPMIGRVMQNSCALSHLSGFYHLVPHPADRIRSPDAVGSARPRSAAFSEALTIPSSRRPIPPEGATIGRFRHRPPCPRRLLGNPPTGGECRWGLKTARERRRVPIEPRSTRGPQICSPKTITVRRGSPPPRPQSATGR